MCISFNFPKFKLGVIYAIGVILLPMANEMYIHVHVFRLHDLAM